MPSVMQLPSKRLRRDNLEEEEVEMVVEEVAADIDEVEDGEELRTSRKLSQRKTLRT